MNEIKYINTYFVCNNSYSEHIYDLTQTRQLCLVVKNPPANAGDIRDAGLIPGLGRSPGGGHGNPLQYSCQKNSMDRGAWQATVPGVSESYMTK